MNLLNISLASLSRQRGKKSFLLLAIALGTAAIIVLFTYVASQRHSIEMQFDEYGSNIIIMPKTENLSLSYGGLNVSAVVTEFREIESSSVDKIKEIPNSKNIRAVSPKLLVSANVGNGQKFGEVVVVGLHFVEELKIKAWWKITGRTPESRDELLIGSEVAHQLGFKMGDELTLRGRKFIVSGIIEQTGSQDDHIIFADYDEVAELFNKRGKVSLVEVSALCADCPIDVLISQISQVMPDARIKGIRQVMQQKMATVRQFELFALALTLVIVLMGGFLIFTSMMGAVVERTREIGIYRAIGYKRGDIMGIILTEALFITLVAALLGILFGVLLSITSMPLLAGFSGDEIIFEPLLLLLLTPVVLLIGLGSTILPALKAAGIEPVVALRTI